MAAIIKKAHKLLINTVEDYKERTAKGRKKSQSEGSSKLKGDFSLLLIYDRAI